MSDPDAIARLQELVRTLRGPDGCPWDREQRPADLRSYLLEEAHEVAAAVDGADRDELRDELGDLVFQVVFLTELMREEGSFTFADAADAIHRKMVARHPHVFGDVELADADAVQRAWERRKVDEESRGVLDGIPATLPALVGAYRIGQKAAGVGFDWPDADGVRRKIEEEAGELARATTDEESEEELGDLLFAIAQLARHRGVDPEVALARANAKFRDRFRDLEGRAAASGRRVTDLDLHEMEALWQDVKRRRREAAGGPPSSER